MTDVLLATSAGHPGLDADDRPLLGALRERGLRAHPAIWDDPEVSWAEARLIVVRSTWDYTNRRQDYLAWAREVTRSTSLWNPPTVLEWNTDKRYLADLADRGIPIVPTLWGADALEEARELGWDEIIVKPSVSAGARDTFRVRLDGAAAPVARVAERGEVMVQPYLGSVADHGEVSVVFVDGEPSHAVLKRPAEGDFRVQLELGGEMERVRLDDEFVDLGRRVVDAVDEPLLYARVDMLRSGDGGFVLAELEAVEPSLYLAHAPEAVGVLADAVVSRLG